MLEDIEHINGDVAGYDMSYDEFEELSRRSWEEVYNYLCVDRSKKRDQRRNCRCNESKKKRIYKQHPRRKLFDYINVIFNQK